MAKGMTEKQRQVGQYYLIEKISQGGMAEIYKGLSYDVHGLKKTVCIKKILPHIAASKEFIDSLIDEAKIAVKLVHGNIAQTYDLGKVGDDYFMVMEFVDGKSLSQIHKRCQAKGHLIPVQYLAHFISEVLSGLDYIHRRADEGGSPLNIVHRDMSPQNLMVSYSGTVKIIDFGIAKGGFKVGATDSGILKGKFAYMSPEQAYGDMIDNRSDIFSVGIILHEMLAGARLFKASDSRETIRNVRRAKIEPPSMLQPDVPDELDRIAMKALAKDRRHRYSHASEMRDDLIKFLHSHYPEFKTSDAAAFVQDVYKDEFTNPQREEADAKTPFLIIDHTNSALADESQFEVTGRTKAPIDFSEYMLEDASDTASKDLEAPSEPDEEPSPPDSAKKYMRRGPPLRKILLKPGIFIPIVVAAATLIAVTVMLIARQVKSPPKVESSYAEVMVVTDPADSDVLLDGNTQGQSSPVIIRNIETGRDHTLVVKKEGYTSSERALNLTPGEFQSLSIVLSQKALPTATLDLETNPPGATVFLDDKETTYHTPASIAGMHTKDKITVGLFLAGHQFWSKKLQLKPGETKSFDIQLVKDFAAIFIDSEPSGALVLLNGAPIGQTPITKEDLEPEKIYKVEFWLKGYISTSREIKAVAGKKDELRVTLEKEPTPAEVEAESRESDSKDDKKEKTAEPGRDQE